MTIELRDQVYRVGKSRVARLMREDGLQGRQPRCYRPSTTDSKHDGPIAPNRLAKVDAIAACDQVWQTNTTYIETAASNTPADLSAPSWPVTASPPR